VPQLKSKPSGKSSHESSEPEVGRGAYLALIAALLGWMFDGAEMGVFSLVGKAALEELLPDASNDEHRLWIAVINAGFLVGAATGGVLFGWLGDRIGRVRAMSLSVLTYALFTGLCGFSQEASQIGMLRFIAALGMGGEWSLGVALVMEVWPNRSRAFMAGLIGAAANVGYLIVGIIGLGLAEGIGSLTNALLSLGLTPERADSLMGHTGWRLIMVIGTLPAVLTFFIRRFVPESEKWEKEQQSGSTTHWESSDLWAVAAGVLGPALIIVLWTYQSEGMLFWTLRIVGTLVGLVVAVAGYSYPALRYCQRMEEATGRHGLAKTTVRRMLLAACLSGIPLLGTWGSTQNVPNWSFELVRARQVEAIAAATSSDNAEDLRVLMKNEATARGYALIAISAGAVVGTIIAAFLGDALGRRWTYVVLCGLSLASIVYLFAGHTRFDKNLLVAAYLAGACTAAFYGWLPLYLPELFVTSVRATGQGFGFNFGRVLAAIGSLQMANLLASSKETFGAGLHVGSLHIAPGWPVLCCLLSLMYVVGMGIIWLAPETKGQPLPD
jgi:MFS family permease